LQDGLLEKAEFAVSQPMPESWIFPTLLRHYISQMLPGDNRVAEAKAIRLANQALGVVDYKKTIYNVLGWLHTYVKRLRNLKMALHYFNQALKMEPHDTSALLHVARISEMTGKKELARRAYERILVFNQTHPEARRKAAKLKDVAGVRVSVPR
jgi:tetratricopeptide (TPR) repeat protein